MNTNKLFDLYVEAISINITVFLLSKLMTVEFYGAMHLKIGSWSHQLCHIRVDNIAFVIWVKSMWMRRLPSLVANAGTLMLHAAQCGQCRRTAALGVVEFTAEP